MENIFRKTIAATRQRRSAGRLQSGCNVYLHESPLSSPVRRLVLVSPCYDDESVEDLGSFRVTSATGLEKSAEEIHLFHSKDDPVAPFTELAKFQRDLPTAKVHIFKDRNHFFQPTFPELKELLKK